MSNIINILLFLALNIAMVVYMFRYSARLKNPLNSNKYLTLEGTEMFFVLLFATGTLAISGGGGGRGVGTGFNLQAIRLLFLEIFLVMVCFVSSHKPKFGIGSIAYIIYMLWLLYSMTYSQAGEYGWRYILKYLYPLVIMLGASAVIRDEEVFLALCIWARRIAFVSAVVVFFVPILQRVVLGVFWYNTALTLHYVTISCISLALYFFYGKDKKDLILAIVFVLPCIIMVHRTGLLAIFTGLAVFCFFKFKWISLPDIAGVFAMGVAIIFYVPAFHEKMFWTEDGKGKTFTVEDLKSGNISEEDIRNNGREATWELLKEEFYYGHEMQGSGIGSCQKFLYEHEAMVKQTHGDYIQMRCDTGEIGMWVYLIVAGLVVIHCFVEAVKPSNAEYLKCCAMIVAGGIVGNYFGMYSDNTVTYTMATTGYPFGFYGVMLGLRAKLNGTD